MNIQKWHFFIATIIFSACIFLPLGGYSADITQQAQQRSFLKIGHRGAAGYEPENTIRSFQKAISMGVDMVELDVRLCGSGELVVIHDDRIDRTTNGTGFVREKTLLELKQFDAGKGERIPTLFEVLDAVDRKVAVQIELKEYGTALPVEETIRYYTVKKGWSRDRFVVSSFLSQELKIFKRFAPNIRIALLGDPSPEIFRQGIELGANFINSHFSMITEEFVGKVHARKMKSVAFAVNHEEDIARMKAYGVDGIVSDYPDKIGD